LLCWLLFVVTKQQSLLRRDTLLLHRLKACWLLLEGLLLLQWLSECWLSPVLAVPQTSDWLLLAEL
jgi:hypothetical protein